MLRTAFIMFGLTAVLSAGCHPGGSIPDDTRVAIRVWSHQGQESENRAMRNMAASFNASQDRIRVDLDFFPDYQYTEKLSIAAAGGDMPDVFDLDGPTVAQFADAGLLAVLTPHFPDTELRDFAQTIRAQGTYRGRLYALGAFDSAMVLYYDKDLFAAAGVKPPAPGTAWTWAQFVSACNALRQTDITPVALHMDITADEWFTYAFSPIIWSAGGRLISEDGQTATGILDSEANVDAVGKWQALFEEGLARRAPVNPDPFGSGQTAMDWTGHWMARGHLKAKGDRLGVMPLPRLGEEPAAACGSWCWAISKESKRKEAASEWLRWVLDPVTGVKPIVMANGAVPARASAYAHFPDYRQEPFATFRLLQENYGRPRPQTPVYPNLTQQFAAALRDIANGADVQARLTRAANNVQRVLDRRSRSTRQ